MLAIGIDPGSLSGCLVMLDDDNRITACEFNGMTHLDIFRLFEDIKTRPDTKQVVLEKLMPFPSSAAKSMHTFWIHYGGLIMALSAHEIPFALVPPQTWQAHYGILRKKKTPDANEDIIKSKDKRKKLANQAFAQTLFPDFEVTITNADALLLAHFAKNSFEKAKAKGLIYTDIHL